MAPVPIKLAGSVQFALPEINEDVDRNLFASALRDVVPPRYADEYASLLTHHAISAEKPPPLEPNDLAEVGIRLGHRDAVATCLADMRRISHYKTSNVADEEDFDRAQLSTSQLVVSPSNGDGFTDLNDALGEMDCFKIALPRGDEWIDWSGTHATWEGFLTTMRGALTSAGMPLGFMRLFQDNKPMPHFFTLPSTRGRMAVGMLLRVPLAEIVQEPANKNCSNGLLVVTTTATTLHNMANRLVLIYEPATVARRGRLITFRKDKNLPWVVELRKHCAWDEKSNEVRLDAVALRLLRDSLEAFRETLQALRQELEVTTSLPDSFRPREVVKSLSRIQRQAAVMRRCLAGDAKVFTAVADDGCFGTELHSIIALAEDLKEVADELESNAVDLFNLRLAMIDFKSQRNMRIFTNMTVIIAPLSIVTGWFGMNFDEMDELHMHGFYYAVAACAFVLIVVLATWLYYVNRDRSVAGRDLADAEVILEKAERDDDD